MRVLFIGCVNFSKTMLDCALKINCVEIVGIVTKSASEFNADFCPLLPVAEKNKIPYLLYDKVKSEERYCDWVKGKAPDVIYCLGWSHLLKENLLSIPRIGVIGHHPTLLPKYRGRHPVIWSLVLGLEKTASSFFFIDPDIDSGDLLDQVLIDIGPNDNAGTLYQKITETACEQLKKISPLLDKGTFIRIKQDKSKATSWRKRTKEDGCIDWRMNCNNIYNLVRALTHPYVGAHCVYNNREVKIWAVNIVNRDSKGIEPGKIIDINRYKIDIQTGDGIICIYDHEFDPLPEIGTYL